MATLSGLLIGHINEQRTFVTASFKSQQSGDGGRSEG